MDDLISRKAAIEVIDALFPVDPMKSEYAQGIACGAALAKTYVEQLPSAQPEPCEDAVSREAVSKWLKQYGQDVLHGKYKFSLTYIWKNLMDLPSVTPKQRKGKWIPVTNGRGGYECDQCHNYAAAWQTGGDRLTNYCPTCGARMEEGEQE